jgi:shikimate kinase / 3-dehydroquinate synthase
MPAEHIILVGLSGSGKSTVGRLLARQLGLPFVDTDDALARRAGRSIPHIFATDGEQRFRALETAAVRDALRGPPAVVSLGGGALLSAETRIRCAQHCMVWLDAAPSVLAARVAPRGDTQSRPLLAGADPAARLADLLAQRRPYYAQAHLRLDASPSADEVVRAARRALARFVAPVRQTLTIPTSATPQRQSYDVVTGRGILTQLGPMVHERLAARRVFVVSNSVVWPLAGGLLEEALGGDVAIAAVRQAPDGETTKTVAQAEQLWTWLAEQGAERRDPVIAFGGGVTGDLTGFVAACYVRGVPFVQIPTTLLAQVDSSIGGKVAVDHALAKNMIGAFKAPELVVVDTALLASLPPEQVAAGWAEVLKHGVILDAGLFGLMEDQAEQLNDLAPQLTLDVVRRSLAIKARVVEEDEFEQGTRMLLNYGHTLGQAIEAATGYRRYLHGHAVSLGMVAAGWIAVQLGLLPEPDLRRIEGVLSRLRLPVRLSGVDPQAVLAAMQRDKKVRQGRNIWVLPRRIGEAVRTAEVPEALAAQALTYLGRAGEAAPVPR